MPCPSGKTSSLAGEGWSGPATFWAASGRKRTNSPLPRGDLSALEVGAREDQPQTNEQPSPQGLNMSHIFGWTRRSHGTNPRCSRHQSTKWALALSRRERVSRSGAFTSRGETGEGSFPHPSRSRAPENTTSRMVCNRRVVVTLGLSGPLEPLRHHAGTNEHRNMQGSRRVTPHPARDGW